MTMSNPRVHRGQVGPVGLVLALTLTAAIGGCGRADDQPDASPSGPEFSVERALADLPVLDGTGPVTLTLADVEAATRVNGLERPDGIEDLDATREWVGGLVGIDADDPPPVFVPLPHLFELRSLAGAEQVAELGWSLLDVQAFAEVRSPPHTFTTITGDVGLETLQDADLADLGDDVFRTGSDDRDDDARTSAPLHMTVLDELLVVSSSTDAIERWSEDGSGRLSDDDGLRRVAIALDRGQAIAATIASFPDVGERERDDTPRPSAIGVGWGVEDGDARMTMACAYRSDDDAEEVASGDLGIPDDDRLVVDDVATDGPVVAVTLRLGPEGRPRHLQEGLFQFSLSCTPP